MSDASQVVSDLGLLLNVNTDIQGELVQEMIALDTKESKNLKFHRLRFYNDDDIK